MTKEQYTPFETLPKGSEIPTSTVIGASIEPREAVFEEVTTGLPMVVEQPKHSYLRGTAHHFTTKSDKPGLGTISITQRDPEARFGYSSGKIFDISIRPNQAVLDDPVLLGRWQQQAPLLRKAVRMGEVCATYPNEQIFSRPSLSAEEYDFSTGEIKLSTDIHHIKDSVNAVLGSLAKIKISTNEADIQGIESYHGMQDKFIEHAHDGKRVDRFNAPMLSKADHEAAKKALKLSELVKNGRS